MTQAIMEAAIEATEVALIAVKRDRNPGGQCKMNTNSTNNGWSRFETAKCLIERHQISIMNYVILK